MDLNQEKQTRAKLEETGDYDVAEILTNVSLVWPMTHLYQNNLKNLFKMQILVSSDLHLPNQNVTLSLKETFYGKCILDYLINSII